MDVHRPSSTRPPAADGGPGVGSVPDAAAAAAAPADRIRVPAPRSGSRPSDWTLNMLAQRRSTHLLRTRGLTRASSSRAVSALTVVPVRQAMTTTGNRWLLVPADSGGGAAEWTSHVLPSTELDHAFRVDLLLRWIPSTAVPTGWPALPAGELPRAVSPDEATGPVALLVERRGPCVVDDGDLAWWQSFTHACGVVGRTPATALVVCATGIRDITAGRSNEG